MAARAGLTRQAIGAIESGQYVPNTLVALRLARLLGCRVEELFTLPDDLEERDVEVIGFPGAFDQTPGRDAAPGEAQTGAAETRVMVAWTRGRWIAHPLAGRRVLHEGFTGADGMMRHRPHEGGTGKARLLVDPEQLRRTALLLGCDPSLGIVGRHMARLARSGAPGHLAWLEAGSQAALDAVTAGTAHLAGAHLLDRASGEFNLPQARQALSHTGGIVVAFARWEQGLVVMPGNPKGIRTAADLARRGVRLVNREPGAGSRTLLDDLLAAAGVSRDAVNGYERTVATHFEVACAVASGGADTGIALVAAAEAYGLDFVPLAEVRFDFILPADHLAHPAVALLLEALQSRALRDELHALPGYDVREMGAIRAEFAAAAA